MPKVSVIMSVYSERIDWIKQSIDSILNQTFRDFEFIIVNDNPERKENALLLEEYAKKDPRICVLTNETNIGLTKSLNKALAVAKGEYIARMDADDISLPERFSKQINYLDSHKEINVLGSYVRHINENGEMCSIKKMSNSSINLRSMILLDVPVVHPVVLFRRFINGKQVFYDESFRYAQDYALWASLIKDCKFTNLKDVLLFYRVSSSQISQKNLNLQNECAKRVLDTVIDNYKLNCNDDIKESLMSVSKVNTMQFDKDLTYSNIRTFVTLNKDNKYCDVMYLLDRLLIQYLYKVRCKYGRLLSIRQLFRIYKDFRVSSLKTQLLLLKVCIF